MEHIVIIGNGIAELFVSHSKKSDPKIHYLLKLSFSFSYRFNVRVYGTHEVWHNPMKIKNKLIWFKD
jgi:hypothetical protein